MLKSGPRTDQNCFPREMQLLWKQMLLRAPHSSTAHLGPTHACASMIPDKTPLHKRPCRKSGTIFPASFPHAAPPQFPLENLTMQPQPTPPNLADYQITSDLARVDWSRVHAWLASSYWTPGISLERIQRAAQNSALVLSAFHHNTQAAFLRVVSDRTRFAYLCDVWVDTPHRGRGLARHLVKHALNHPDLATCNWLLATQDAHRVYQKLGFTPLPQPDRFMVKGTFGAANS